MSDDDLQHELDLLTRLSPDERRTYLQQQMLRAEIAWLDSLVHELALDKWLLRYYIQVARDAANHSDIDNLELYTEIAKRLKAGRARLMRDIKEQKEVIRWQRLRLQKMQAPLMHKLQNS